MKKWSFSAAEKDHLWTKWEGTPMERKLGLYVTLGNDGSLKRTLVSISGETNLESCK